MCLLVQHGGHKLDATTETQRLCSGLGQDFGKEPFSTIDLAREHVVTKNDSWVIDKPVTEHVLHFFLQNETSGGCRQDVPGFGMCPVSVFQDVAGLPL